MENKQLETQVSPRGDLEGTKVTKGTKAVIIGASSGIGYEVTKLLLAEGWHLGVAARREEKLLELKALAPDRIEVMTIDITHPDATERLLALINKLGGMDLYFHASGIGWQNRTLEADIEQRTVETNALGFTRMIGSAYRYFVEKGEGHIAAITSIAGTKGLGPAPAYSATKALQATYLESLEQLIHQRGLRICITDIRPGFVDTALLRPANPEKEKGFPYPMMMRPEAVAREIVCSINKRRHVRIIDWRYRIITFFWRLIPRCLWRLIRL
ncbi:MAG: SDR family NAD(P)-dependent oxidoreductase [Bacteroidaceae bacterium]|nr:SDR family NAD(P)-dependent oxidoreductase [Bacteroidaceae bacterium]